jgi:hypothetical protein
MMYALTIMRIALLPLSMPLVVVVHAENANVAVKVMYEELECCCGGVGGVGWRWTVPLAPDAGFLCCIIVGRQYRLHKHAD